MSSNTHTLTGCPGETGGAFAAAQGDIVQFNGENGDGTPTPDEECKPPELCEYIENYSETDEPAWKIKLIEASDSIQISNEADDLKAITNDSNFRMVLHDAPTLNSALPDNTAFCARIDETTSQQSLVAIETHYLW